MAVTMSEDYGSPLPDDVPTAWERLQRVIKDMPEALALVAMHQPAGLYGLPNIDLEDDSYKQAPYLRWDYRTFATAIDRLAAGLQAQGVRKGMPMITFLPNGAERLLAYFAANKIGCPFTPISPKNLVNLEEVAHMVKVCLINDHATEDKIVFIAQDSTLTEQINTLPNAEDALKILVNGTTASDRWMNMATVFESAKAHVNGAAVNAVAHVPNDEAIMFTSGSTSMPKGCRWAHPQLAYVAAGRESLRGFGPGDRWASVMPNNHAYAHAVTMFTICGGTAVVYPGPAFEPQMMFTALKREHINYVSLVPTMIMALMAVKNATGEELPHLKSIMLGGAVLTPQVLQQCIDLGAEEIDNAYGMTDGVYMSLGSQKDLGAYVNGNDVAVGKVFPGQGVKICHPGETTAVPRNVDGELHVSSRLSCGGYIGKKTDDWYTDADGREWFKTGDQSRMDEQGRIFIVGRFKDIVIRGGKNLATTAMEACLARNPKLEPYNIQIVPAPDVYAGEVPVAISEKPISSNLALELQETLRKSMGLEYVPDETIYVGDLGLDTYPRTMLGKIKKQELAALVKKLRADKEASGKDHADKALADEVRNMWARAVGLPDDRLSDDAALADFADSITVMRVRDRIKRQTGRNLSIVEIAEAGTVGKIIELLQSRQPEQTAPTKIAKPRRQGPPEVDDMVHLVEEPELYEPTKELVTKTMEPFGLTWEDVQDVIPAYDFVTMLASTGVMDSWNFKLVMLPKAIDKQHLRQALEEFIRINPLLPSFFVWDKQALGSELALHVTLHPSQKLMDAVIEDGGSVKTVEDLKQVGFKYPKPKHGRFPGPMTRFLLFDIEETKQAAFVINVNHAIIDASYGQIMQDDIDRVLGNIGKTETQVHPDYKLWADSYYSLRTSPEARRAVKWHQKRLANLGSHRKALWPATPPREPYDDAVVSGEDGYLHSFEAPGIKAFRQEHRSVTAPIFVKAALALLNTYKTKHTHALFANLEAARTAYPFITKAMADSGQYEATEVAGPTFQSVINLVEVKPEETVAQLLQRMQEEQTNLTKYASAPWRELMSALGDAGHLLPDVTQTQVYNWVPGMGTTGTNPFKNFENLAAVVRPQVGLAVNTGLGGPEGNTLFAHVRGDSLSDAEMREFAKELEAVTSWMVEKSNWNAPVGGFTKVLDGRSGS